MGGCSLIPWWIATPSALAGWRLPIRPRWILLSARAVSSSRIASLLRWWRIAAPVSSLRPRWRDLAILRALGLSGISVLIRRSWRRLSIGPRGWGAILVRGRRRVAIVLLIRLGWTQVIVGSSSSWRMIGLAVPV